MTDVHRFVDTSKGVHFSFSARIPWTCIRIINTAVGLASTARLKKPCISDTHYPRDWWHMNGGDKKCTLACCFFPPSPFLFFFLISSNHGKAVNIGIFTGNSQTQSISHAILVALDTTTNLVSWYKDFGSSSQSLLYPFPATLTLTPLAGDYVH